MRIFGLNISRSKKQAPAGLASVYGGGWFPLIREPYAGAWQHNREEWNPREAQTAFHAIFACVTRISQDVAKLRIKLMQQGDQGIWTEVESAAFSPVLNKPNDYQNRVQFFESWMNSKLLHGNTYVLKQRDQRNVVNALYVLDPCRVKPLVADDGSLFYQFSRDYLSGVYEEAVTVPASEIIHDRINTLYHPLCGISPLFANAAATSAGQSILRNSARFFRNGSNPSGIITAPESIPLEVAKRLKESWESSYSGENVGRVAILGDGLSYTPMSFTASEAQLIEQLRLDAEIVCTTFHVPSHMVGIRDLPAYPNNVEAINQQYYSQCLQIHLESIEICLDEGLGLNVQSSKTLGTEFDIDGLIRMDSSTKVKTLTDAIKGGLMKPNEGRARFDLPPVEGGDEVYLQQQNYSLSALAKRDSQDDPFATTPPPAAAPSGGGGTGADSTPVDPQQEAQAYLVMTRGEMAYLERLRATP